MRRIVPSKRYLDSKNPLFRDVARADFVTSNGERSNALYRDMHRGAVCFNGKSFHEVPIDEIVRAITWDVPPDAVTFLETHYTQDMSGSMLTGLLPGGMTPRYIQDKTQILFASNGSLMRGKASAFSFDIRYQDRQLSAELSLKSPLVVRLIPSIESNYDVSFDVNIKVSYQQVAQGFRLDAIEIDGPDAIVVERIILGEFSLFIKDDLFPIRKSQAHIFGDIFKLKAEDARGVERALYLAILASLDKLFPENLQQQDLDGLKYFLQAEPSLWLIATFMDGLPSFLRQAILHGCINYTLDKLREKNEEEFLGNLKYAPTATLIKRLRYYVERHWHLFENMRGQQIRDLRKSEFDLLRDDIFRGENACFTPRIAILIGVFHAEYVINLYESSTYKLMLKGYQWYFKSPEVPTTKLFNMIKAKLKSYWNADCDEAVESQMAFLAKANLILADPYRNYFQGHRTFFNSCPHSMKVLIVQAYCDDLSDHLRYEAGLRDEDEVNNLAENSLKKNKLTFVSELKKLFSEGNALPTKKAFDVIVERYPSEVTGSGYVSGRVNSLVSDLRQICPELNYALKPQAII